MKDAIYDFYSAFELNPGIAQTFMQRTLVLSFQRKYRQIVEEFNERIKQERLEDASLYVLVAKARIKCGDNEGAIRDLAKALEFSKNKDPQISNLYLQKGICYENVKDWANAVVDFSKCIAIDPQFANAYYHRGVCKLHEGNEKGVLDLDMAIKLNAKFFEAFLSRASYNHSKGMYVEGIEDCNHALRLEPSSIRAHLLRGACNCKIHEYGSAIADFTKAAYLDKTCQFAFYNRAVTYQLLEDYKNAIKDYSIVLLLSDDSVRAIELSVHNNRRQNAYRNRGLIYWKQGDAENALCDLHAARDNFPGDARLHGLLALCLQKVGRTQESLDAFTDSIKVNRTLTEALLGRGNVHAAVGNCVSAKRDYARVVHMYPTCIEAYVNMAYTLQMEGRYQKAWDLFAMALAIDPTSTSALEGRAVVNYTMRNYFGALMDISKAIEICPNNAEYLTNRSVIHVAMNDAVKALMDNKLALKIDPQYALAYFNIGNIYFSQSRWEIAAMYYNKALEFDPDDDAAYLNRGITRAQLQDADGALDDFNTAVAMSTPPHCAEARFNRAQLLHALGNLEAADADFSAVLAAAPRDQDALRGRARVRAKLGRFDDAMRDYAGDVLN
ncbi:cytochrome c oxidase subunit 1 [Entophlyctis luteolus]|nr:cytochrome c oxidase subunit 1 [Entophlyctis luteolus]